MEARSIFVGYSPLPKEDVALVPYFEVDHIVPNHETKSFQKRFIGKSLLEAASSILNQSVQDVQSSDLTMRITILPIQSQSERFA